MIDKTAASRLNGRIFFAAAGIVAWPQAAIMMLAAIAGGYCGAPLARALPALVVRAMIIAIGLSMSVVFSEILRLTHAALFAQTRYRLVRPRRAALPR